MHVRVPYLSATASCSGETVISQGKVATLPIQLEMGDCCLRASVICFPERFCVLLFSCLLSLSLRWLLTTAPRDTAKHRQPPDTCPTCRITDRMSHCSAVQTTLSDIYRQIPESRHQNKGSFEIFKKGQPDHTCNQS